MIEFALDSTIDENAAPMAVELYLELPKPSWSAIVPDTALTLVLLVAAVG